MNAGHFGRHVAILFFGALGSVLFGQSISTGLPAPTSVSLQQGFMFDLQATSNLKVDSVDVVGFDVADLEIWTTIDGTGFAGKEENPHAWHRVGLLDSAILVVSGGWASVNLDTSVLIKANQRRGFYLTRTDTGDLFYTPVANTGVLHFQDSNLAYYTGPYTDYFKKWSAAVPAITIHYTVQGPFATDVAINRVFGPNLDPLQCQVFSATESLKVEFLNLGSLPIPAGAFVPVSFSLDGGATVSEFAVTTSAVAPGGTFSHTFTSPLDLSSIGARKVFVSHAFAGDLNNSNDTLEHVFRVGGEKRITSFPWEETFEHLNHANIVVPPQGWTQEVAEATGPYSDWYFGYRGNGSRPSVDHTTGVYLAGLYAYANDLGNNAMVNMRSPCFDLTGVANPQLRFWMYSRAGNGSTNSFWVDVLDVATGVLTPSVHGPIGALTPNSLWHLQQVNLSAFSGKLIRLVFRATTDHGFPNSPRSDHDIAIDDVAVYDLLPTVGQAPQIGLAKLKIGYTRNLNFVDLGPGVSGPFFSQVRANEPMVIEFSGQPNQPLLLLGGTLNPVAASYASIGSLDIGGPVDPVSGIPSGIVVLADGNLVDGVNPFFNTGPLGVGQFAVTIPNLPPGLLATFQCVMKTDGSNGSYIALSNAIKVNVD